MRSQKEKGFATFQHSSSISGWTALPMDRRIKGGASFSGNERDSVYLSAEGKNFVSISGITGLDDPGDGRSFAILDFDRDGWPDLVVASVTAPTLQLYRNQMGDKSSSDVKQNKSIAVRLVGGNDKGAPTTEWSNRDAVGAIVMVDIEGRQLVREHRAGEGLAAQNSPTTLIGIGHNDAAKSIKVRWPSGKTTEVGKVAAGSVVTLYENPAQAPARQAAVIKKYKVDSIRPPERRDLAQLR